MEPYLQMIDISKYFNGVRALEGVSLQVSRGEVLALCGENGAGKSTLMKILTGVYTLDKSENTKILVDGKEVEISDPNHARELGISIIYQELSTLGNLTVAQNIFLGREPLTKMRMVDSKKMNDDAMKLMDRLNMDIDVKQMISKLSVGQQQMVEIAKAISFDSKILVMDEPTASLSYKETQTLFKLIKDLRDKQIGIIYISHRMEELFELADRITILRDGQSVDTLLRKDATTQILVKKMVDRDLSEIYVKNQSFATDEEIFRVENLSQQTRINENGTKVRNVSFNLHKGEILGFSGLVGSGRTEIMELIFGMYPHTGKIFIEGKEVVIKSPNDAISNGIGFVTENRKELGLVLGMTVRQNISLASLGQIQKMDFIDQKKEAQMCGKYIDSLKIKTPSQKQKVIKLSGGNQQKVVIAKWLANHPAILIVDEPTRGIDIGAKAEVHAVLSELARQGIGIIMISSELPEVMAISDRIIVVGNGQIKGEFMHNEVTQEMIMDCAVSS